MRSFVSKISAVVLSIVITAGALPMLPGAAVGAKAEDVEELSLTPLTWSDLKDTSKTTVSTRTKTSTKTVSSTKNITLKNSKGKVVKSSSTKTTKVSDKTKSKTNTVKYTYFQETTTVKTRTIITDKYTKGLTKKVRTTKVTTTTTVKKKAYAATEKLKAKTAARIDANIVKAFNDLGYRVKADLNFPGGWYDTKARLVAISDDSNTIYHEIGHFVGFVGAGDGSSFTSIYNAEKSKYYKKSDKSYATQSQSEFFASCYALYVTDNANLKAKMPKTYAHIKKTIGAITDERVAKIQKVYKVLWKD